MSRSRGVRIQTHNTSRAGLTPRVARLTVAVAVSMGLAGCHLPPVRGPAFSEIRAPAAYRVAIAPVVGSHVQRPLEATSSETASALRFTYLPGELRTRLIRSLIEAEVTTAVVAVGELDLLEARAARADLLLRLQLTRAAPRHVGLSGFPTVGAGLLWFGTWIGGLLMPDCLYDPGIEVECTAISPHDGRPIARFALSSTPIHLRFVDRNPFISAALAQSLILPPFWTSDDPIRTSHSLSERGTEHIATQLARVIEELERPSESQAVRVSFQQPANGERTGAITRLHARIEALGPIEEISLRVNGTPSPTRHFNPAQDRLPGFDLEAVVRLQPGRNEIQVEARQGSVTCSRTIVLFCDETTAFEEIEPSSAGAPSRSLEPSTSPTDPEEQP